MTFLKILYLIFHCFLILILAIDQGLFCQINFVKYIVKCDLENVFR